MRLRRKSEDCLTLDVWAPVGADSLPVVVWLHGGAFYTGAGSQPWYDGARLARATQTVVVTVTYRLGALGFLRIPEAAEPPPATNLGMHDQLAALAWVKENISAFGGDPAAVTLAGQSAGAQSALAMLHALEPQRPFHRVVLQSSPLGLPPLTVDEATYRCELFLHALGIRGDIQQLWKMPITRLLDAQAAVARQQARPLQLGPPFQLVADSTIVPADLVAKDVRATDTPVLLGNTEHEADAFCVLDPVIQAMTRADAEAALRPLLGDSTDRRYQELAATEPSASPARIASNLTTDHFFHRDLEPLATRLRATGNPTHTYRFLWHPVGSPLRACHCIDLPFTFGNLDAWRDAPLLTGARSDEIARLTSQVQGALGAFVHGSDNAGLTERFV